MRGETQTLVSSRYRLDHRIASGGMGEVWEARDTVLGRRVAIKLLHPSLAAEVGFRDRFRREAQAAARLSHPGVVAVYDYGDGVSGDGVSGDGAAFLVMELVDGEPLSSVLARQGRLTPTTTMSIVAQAASVLAAAHLQGIVHRDVKPANLLVEADGRVRMTDFGIARAVDRPTATEMGTVMGTVAYMSPEQVRGERVLPASDIYSLGVVAYQCLTGAKPFAAEESVAVALAHLQQPVPPLPRDVPDRVRRLVISMLAKDPARRPASAAALSAAASLLAEPDETGALGRTSSEHRAAAPVDPGMATGRLAATRPHSPFGHPRSRRLPRPLVGLAAAVLAAGTLTVGVAVTSGAASVGVPNVAGQRQTRAESSLASRHLRVSAAPADEPGVPASTVVGQRPAAGTRVRQGARVTLTVASGFVELRKRSLDHLRYRLAAARVRHRGLVPREVPVVSSQPSGDVVSFSPAGRLREGTTVRIKVAVTRHVAPPTTTTAPPVVTVAASAPPTASAPVPSPAAVSPTVPPAPSPPRPSPAVDPPGGGATSGPSRGPGNGNGDGHGHGRGHGAPGTGGAVHGQTPGGGPGGGGPGGPGGGGPGGGGPGGGHGGGPGG